MPSYPFNRQLDIKLMALVKSNPSLYNPHESKYTDCDTREVIWQKIGDELGRPAAMCKSRWVNIRDMFRRRMKLMQKQPAAKRRYNYKYDEELAFMVPFFKKSIAKNQEEYPEFYDEDVSSCEVEIPDAVFVNAGLDSFDCEEKEEKPRVIDLRGSRRSKGSEDSRRDFNASGSVSQELNPADPIDMFLMTIGTSLRKFTPYYLNQAKSKIFEVVQEYDLQQIMDKDQSLNKNKTQ